MNEAAVVGVVGILVGLLVCLRGYAALRVIITLLGAWVGLLLGAAVAAGATGQAAFTTPATWVGAVLGALLLGALAFSLYRAAVIIGTGALGYVVATALAAALGVDGTLALRVIGLVAAVLLAVVALATDLPAVLLVVLTALAGANIAVTGLLLLLQAADLGDLEAGRVPAAVAVQAGLGTLALAVVGAIVQLRGVRTEQRMRAGWGA